jgi:hypothetical protein
MANNDETFRLLTNLSTNEDAWRGIWESLPYDHESNQPACPDPEDLRNAIREAARRIGMKDGVAAK